MKTLVVSDVHLSDNFNIFLKFLFPFIDQILEQEKDLDKIIFLGDVFDSSTLSNVVLLLFKTLFNKIKKKGVEIEIVVGNHDLIDKKTSAFDILMLDNIKIINNVSFQSNYIYLPYIFNKKDFINIFDEIKKYIKNNNYSEYYIFSHNDFSTLYQFRNNFFDVESVMEHINVPVYLINGHNHVPVFKKNNLFYILNLGCAVNLNFKDKGEYNNFLILDDSKIDVDDRIRILQNKDSVQYYTFNIKTDSDVKNCLSTINHDNLKYVNFKILSPNITISDQLKSQLCDTYNIVSIQLEYDLGLSSFDHTETENTDVNNTTSNIYSILNDLGIELTEFIEHNSMDDVEKIEVLYSLLDLMFEDLDIDENNREEIIRTINKYYLKI
jgi:predicted phosphodiesterase